MEIIFGVLMGIFVGVACAGYMFIQPLADRDKTIAEYKQQDEQLYKELKEARAENEDLNEDKEYLEKQLKKISIVANDFMIKEDKLSKIKELVKDYQDNN